MTVACVLRSGGKYEPRHVAGLAKQVNHYMPQARFVCLSDVSVPCERVPLATDWPSWWAKIELFRHFKGPTLYLDLDTVMQKDCTSLVGSRLRMIRNWVYPELLASGVMSWTGDYSSIADKFESVKDRVIKTYVTRERWGDQAFIAENSDAEGFEPGLIVSYKYQVMRKSRLMHDAHIVAFNNDTLPWDGPDWARKWWE